MKFDIPVSKSQKFQIGQRVYDARMKAEGTIIYSYHQRYGCGAHEEYSIDYGMSLGQISWIAGKNLTYLRDGDEKELKRIFRYILRTEGN